MIPIREIKEIARRSSVPPSTIERDYAQNWLLAYLDTREMVFKGGTCIRKVFIENYRFSDDLDFTLTKNLDLDALQNLITESITRTREECGIQFEEDIDIINTKSGFRAITKFRIINRSTLAPITIKLDITEPKNEMILLPTEKMPIYHHFSDSLDASTTSYSLEEIMAEKIRSLFQRTRSRDLYDIDQLSDVVDRERVKSIIRNKCKCKNVTLSISPLVEKQRSFAASWNASLHHQMGSIPDFNEAFTRTIASLEYYLL
jgi:predicted nucleotidyltransferase component of viral defense system